MPIKKLVFIYKDELLAEFNQNVPSTSTSQIEENSTTTNWEKEVNGGEVLERLVRRDFGQKCEIKSVGHDAFESRNGSMDIFDGTSNQKALRKIEKWCKEKFSDEINKLVDKIRDDAVWNNYCSDLVFIGRCIEVKAEGRGEFEYYVKVPELLYGLPALLKSMLKYYQKLNKLEMRRLKKKFGRVCLWTFAEDCHCCG